MIARIAGRQRGVVSRAQLIAAGVSRHAIDRRLRSGSLHLLHRGVYAVGHTALHPHAPLVAALLAVGAGAAFSHLTAAVLWELLRPERGPVHLIRAGSRPTARPGIALHRADLPATDRRRRDGLPVTSPQRTLLDLAATEPELLPRALNEALALRLLRPGALSIPRGHRGAEALRHALAPDEGFTRSKAERALLALVLKAQLPRPQTNVWIGGHEVDAFWPAPHLLIVEVDGFATHGRRRTFEADRARDGAHLIAGYRTLRITWRQLTDRPEAVAALLGAALATRAAA